MQTPPVFRRSSPRRHRWDNAGPTQSDSRRRHVLARRSGLVCRAQVALKELPWMPRRRRVRSGTSCAFLPHHSAAAAPSTPWQDPPVFRRPIRLARRTRRSMGISRERTAVQSSGQRKRRYAARLLARRRTARSYARLLLRLPLVRPRVLARNQSRVVAAAKRSGRSARDPNNESPHPSWRRRARRALQAIGREILPLVQSRDTATVILRIWAGSALLGWIQLFDRSQIHDALGNLDAANNALADHGERIGSKQRTVVLLSV